MKAILDAFFLRRVRPIDRLDVDEFVAANNRPASIRGQRSSRFYSQLVNGSCEGTAEDFRLVFKAGRGFDQFNPRLSAHLRRCWRLAQLSFEIQLSGVKYLAARRLADKFALARGQR